MYDADICLRYCQICWVFLGIPRNLAGSAPALQKFLAALRRPRGMFPAPCRRLALRPSNGVRLPALARPSAPPPACCTSLRRPRQCGLARRHPPLTGVPAPPHHPTRPPSPSQCRWGGVGASRIGRRMEAVDCFQIELTNWLISRRIGRLCRAGTQAGMREEVRKNSDVWWNLSRSAGFFGLPEVLSNKLPDVWAVRRWDVRRVGRLLWVEKDFNSFNFYIIDYSIDRYKLNEEDGRES